MKLKFLCRPSGVSGVYPPCGQLPGKLTSMDRPLIEVVCPILMYRVVSTGFIDTTETETIYSGLKRAYLHSTGREERGFRNVIFPLPKDSRRMVVYAW